MSSISNANRHILRNFPAAALILTGLLVLVSQQEVAASGSTPQVQQMTVRPLAFTPNHGQWADSILYRADAENATLWFTRDGVYYEFSRQKIEERHSSQSPQMPTKMLKNQRSLENLLVKTTFEGANSKVAVRGEGLMAYKCNYFIGSDPTRWHTDVPNYQSIVYQGVYEGIDLRFRGEGDKVEYDFIAAPGADLNQISLGFDGANSVSIDSSGDLIAATAWNVLKERAPVIYQERGSERISVSGQFRLTGPSSIAFSVSGNYDPSYALAIDPVLTFSTFLGGSNSEIPGDVAVDGTHSVYVCGYTYSSDFPTLGGYDNTFNTNSDVFVTKFNPSGSTLAFSTFIGGSGFDEARAITLYSGFAAYGVFLTGFTTSSNFPRVTAVDTSLGGSSDAFVATLSTSGNVLNFCTYLGGSGSDEAYDIAVRCRVPCAPLSLAVWIVGATSSTDFPTLNAFSTTYGGSTDAFVTEYTVGFGISSLTYSTYYGGSGYDAAYAIAVDGTSSFTRYITGETHSTNFPTTNPLNPTLTGTTDAFVAGLDVGVTGHLHPVFSTYFGGAEPAFGQENAGSILLRNSGNICIAGTTGASGLGTAGAFSNSYNGGKTDVFVAELNHTASSLVRYTYLGGSGADSLLGPSGMISDSSGDLFLTGQTSSPNFPMKNWYDSSFTSSSDLFIAELNSSESALKFGTYLGGSFNDIGKSIALDDSSCAYVFGITSGSSSFPLVNPYDAIVTPPFPDCFLTKICIPQYTCGDANGDGQVNISDVVFLISYIFSGGPAPNPLLSGDSNCDSIVNISDAVYLISYIFGGGSAPCAACK